MDAANAGPLKVTDIVNWASFLAAFDRARSQPGHMAAKLWESFDQPARTVYDLSLSSTRSQVREVSALNQLILIQALNKGLRQLVPGPLVAGKDSTTEGDWEKAVRVQMTDAFGSVRAAN